MTVDPQLLIQRAMQAEPLRQPLLRAVIRALQLPRGSVGLDAGCGIGLQATLLADAVGPEGRVMGIDLIPDLLAYAAASQFAAGHAQRIAYSAADLGALPFADGAFDWVWSADCAGYPHGDLAPLLSESVRVVRPGGDVILLGWSSQQLLPGYPFLEARLNATCSAYLPYLSGKRPAFNFLRALRWFREAGLQAVTAQTFVGDVQGPVSSDERTALASLFEMLWGERQRDVTDADWEAIQRLCQPLSPDFIADLPDYYAFFTYSLFRGKRALS